MYSPDPKHNGVNFVAPIKHVQKKLDELTQEYDFQATAYRKSLAGLRKMNTACEKCNATGKVLRRRACAEDDRPDPDNPNDYRDCPECSGSGLSKEVCNDL